MPSKCQFFSDEKNYKIYAEDFIYPSLDIIHTVGPIGEYSEKLASCYLTSLTLAKENQLKSIVSL